MLMPIYSALTTPESVIIEAAAKLDKEYEIECHEGSEDFESLQRMTQQGIDAHLTAIFFEEFEGAYGKRGFRFQPESLGVLCRRLGNSEEENDQNLRSAILYTLDIEEI